MEGRVNLNAPFTGRTTDTTEEYTEDVVYTRRTVYRRASGTQGMWQEFPASAAKGGIPTDRLPQYVRLMLGHRASVHRRSEAWEVSAHLNPKDIESVDRTVGRNLRSATAIDAEAWINDEGRIVRVHQKIHFASGPDIDATLTLTDFKSPMPVNAPTAS
ncbi:Lipoprotein OS=Streptomyces fumanus OX=67302 GN=GCM10018772_61880 PE=4 SV=1 [Streptomyces fumanus]